MPVGLKIGGDDPTVVLPVETVARELDSKLVVACALADAGLRAVVAHEDVAESIGRASKRIVLLGKDIFSETRDVHPADQLIGNESAIVYLHDEGAMFPQHQWTADVLQKHQVDKLRRRRIDRVCVWGERQAQAITAHADELQPMLAVTGTPRFDLCEERYAWLSDRSVLGAIDNSEGFILACTRFTSIAHSEGLQSPFRRKFNRRIWPDGTELTSVAENWFSRWYQDTRDFSDFVLLLKQLARANPRTTLAIRPHPSENEAFFRAAFAPYANVLVSRTGSALDWIRAARVVVHSNCTTGVEAVLAGRPVVNFLPGNRDNVVSEIEIAREAGRTVHTIADAVAAVADMAAAGTRPPPPTWSAGAIGMLNNLREEATPLVVRQVLATVRARGINSSRLALSAERTARSLVKRVVRRVDPYAAAKRAPFVRERLEAVVSGYRTMAGGRASISRATSGLVVIQSA